MIGLSTKETKLSYRAGITGVGNFTEIAGLMEVPELGGDPEQIDVTTLSDEVRKYIPGVRDLGELAFNFLYDNSENDSNFRVLKRLQEGNSVDTYKVEYPDGTTHEFNAFVSVKMDAAAINEALTFTATFSLQSDIEITDPS